VTEAATADSVKAPTRVTEAATANGVKAPAVCAPADRAALLARARGRAARIRGASRLAPLAVVSAHGAVGAVRTGRGVSDASRLTGPGFAQTAAPFIPTRIGRPISLCGWE